MKIKFFDPAKGYSKIKDEVSTEIDRVLSAGDLILRDDVERFEKSLAEYVGTKYAVALNSGTDALYLSLKALGIGKDNEVLVPSYTFVATAQVIKQVGGKPILYDIDGLISYTEGKAQRLGDILNHINALIIVDMEGMVNTYPGRVDAANRFNIPIIEDACQAIGALKNPTSDVQCWSFYPAKILGAYGDAGAITTNNKKIYDYIREARNHFKDSNSDWGVNSRMDNLQAAILNVKFKYLPEVLKIRKNIAEMYDQYLKGINGLELPEPRKVYQDYVIKTDRRDELFNYLKEQGIETLKNNYPWPIPKLPKAQEYEDTTLRIPCNENLTDEEVLYIIEKIQQFYK